MSSGTSTSKEPAIKSYFFGKGYEDLLYVIKEAWQRNMNAATYCFDRVQHYGTWYEKLYSLTVWGGSGFSIIVFGSLSFAMISTLHIGLLVSFFTLIYLGFTLLWSLEKTLLLIKQLFVTCPKCHKRNPLPEYYCDKCGAIHRHLIPNSYGIFRHQCQCGNWLPCSFLTNRGRLQARCPEENCHQLLHRDQFEAPKICIPIMGGPSAGKTTFMFSLVREIMEFKAREWGYEAEFIESNDEAQYQKIIEDMAKGVLPDKTVTSIPSAFNIAFKKGGKTRKLLYLYDPSGETFENTDNLTGHHYQGYMDALILIIDPFSIPAVRKEYEEELKEHYDSIQPSNLQAQDAVNRMLLSLESTYGLKKTEKVKVPLAVVFSKVDLFYLDEKIGEGALANYCSVKLNENHQEIRNKLIREQLSRWEESALINQLDFRICTVNFFATSLLSNSDQKDTHWYLLKDFIDFFNHAINSH